MEKVSKILLKVAGWIMLALAVYMLIMNALAIMDALKYFAGSSSGDQATQRLSYLLGLIIGSILGVVFRAVAGPKGIRLKKGSFAWGIVLMVFQVLGFVIGSGFTWYVFLIDLFYFVAACLFKFGSKSSAA